MFGGKGAVLEKQFSSTRCTLGRPSVPTAIICYPSVFGNRLDCLNNDQHVKHEFINTRTTKIDYVISLGDEIFYYYTRWHKMITPKSNRLVY